MNIADNINALQTQLDHMAALPGVLACAMVEISTGMVVVSAGNLPGKDLLAEAASDYWRLYGRQAQHFAPLGDLQTVTAYHRDGTVSLIPVAQDKIIVAFTQFRQMDWNQWMYAVQLLRQLLEVT